MPGNGLFKLRYIGARFRDRRLPVDVLTDLPAFRELIVAFAKAEWRARNPHRARVPKGFDAGLTFNLVAIEEGSAVPVLQWDRETTQESLPGFADQLEEVVDASFGQVVNLFAQAAADVFPAELSSDQVRALNKFGSTLRDDERIEFSGIASTDGNVVYLNSHIRRNLINNLTDRYVAEVEGTGKLLGSVASLVDDIGFIVVDTQTYLGEIRVPINNDLIRSDFDGAIDQTVELRLQVELDRNDRITAVIEVKNATIIDEQLAIQLERCKSRLRQISDMQDGWHDGDGLAPSKAAIEAADRFLDKRYSLSDLYRIYPTDEGGVLFEFEISGWDWSVECLIDGSVEFYGIEIKGERSFDPVGFGSISQDFLELFDNHAK